MANIISKVVAHNDYHNYLWLILTSWCYLNVTWSVASDADTLLNFKKSLSNDSALYNWVDSSSVDPCSGAVSNWVGVRCNNDSSIDKLLLGGMGLSGMIDIDSLVQLPNLRTLNLMHNNFVGALPPVNKLTSLKNLYLSYNRFSGQILDGAFASMNSLRELYLAQNQITGEMPRSLVALPKLLRLNLEGNLLQGRIPNFRQPFIEFNVAGNHFSGPIPAALAGIDPASFTGNEGLCGKPLPSCKSSPSRKRTLIIIGVAVGAGVALAAILAFTYARRRPTDTSKSVQGAKSQNKKFALSGKEAAADDGIYDVKDTTNNRREIAGGGGGGGGGGVENGKLHFVRNDRERFQLQELLRASAEVLGSGTFGSSYKAIILSGPAATAMVVKRFRHMNNLGKDQFHEHMTRLGTLSHPNLLPLVAFYYRKEEKLLVSDFIENGSLANHLHGKRGPGQAGLDWPTRLKVIRGVAKGLAYLHKEFPTLNLPHGHLKSSNVLLDHTFEPLLTDYALIPVVNKDHAQQVMVAYKSPDFTQNDRTSRKTDVWSLGILILEMLTGKFPANYLRQGSSKGNNNAADLATWVNSVVREEWTGEVFDKDMKQTKNGEGEMLKLLKIGMCCCEWNMERRWDLREALDKIEELKERDAAGDNDDFSSNASEGEIYSSRAMTDQEDDDFSFSRA